jgi:uncharacterized protein (DUF3084 family)
MLIRISLIVAIIGGLAVSVLNMFQIREKLTTLQNDLASEKTARAAAEGERDKNKQEWDKAAAELKTTKETLVTTTENLTKATEEAATQTKRAEKLNEDLTKTREERDTAQNDLAAYKASGYSAAEVASMGQQYKSLQETLGVNKEENRLLARKVIGLENELDRYRDPNKPVYLPAALKGKVLVSDPKWNFVVVNIGVDQGVLEYGELLINRNGRLVAKVRVSRVEKDRSVANIMPGWQLGEVIEGDQVTPAHPASS